MKNISMENILQCCTHQYKIYCYIFNLQEEVEEARRKQEEAAAAALAAAATPKHHHVAERDNEEDDINNDEDLETDTNIVDPIEERRTLAERNERLQDQLKVILLMNAYHFS